MYPKNCNYYDSEAVNRVGQKLGAFTDTVPEIPEGHRLVVVVSDWNYVFGMDVTDRLHYGFLLGAYKFGAIMLAKLFMIEDRQVEECKFVGKISLWNTDTVFRKQDGGKGVRAVYG